MNVTDMSRIYVVCSGNTCRSPMGQRILQEKLGGMGLEHITVASRAATLALGANSPTMLSKKAADLILKKYDDIGFVESHKVRPLSPQEIETADLIIAMEPRHTETLLTLPESYTPGKELKVHTLGDLVGERNLEIADPIGHPRWFGFTPDQDEYEQVFDQIEMLLGEWLARGDTPQVTIADHFEENVARIISDRRKSRQNGIIRLRTTLLDHDPQLRKGWYDSSEAHKRYTLLQKDEYRLAYPSRPLFDLWEVYELSAHFLGEQVDAQKERYSALLEGTILPAIRDDRDTYIKGMTLKYDTVFTHLFGTILEETGAILHSLVVEGSREQALIARQVYEGILDELVAISDGPMIESFYSSVIADTATLEKRLGQGGPGQRTANP